MLRDELESAKHSVTTDVVSVTIGEITAMYNAGELNIRPDFQRLFRWLDDKKSNLIESILIGIPIPPVFAFENSDGTWELIDGLQRISTILEFMGVLIDPDTNVERRSVLLGTKYLPSLKGVVWDPKNKNEKPLDKALQLFFRRHRIDFQILKYPSDPRTKFDLFQRLNRGGTYANEQEVRTCSMVLVDPEFTETLKTFASMPSFRRIFKITKEQILRQEDLELAVRLIVHVFEDLPKGTDVQQFLDDAILAVMSERSRDEVFETVEWTVETLDRLYGETALLPPSERRAGIARRFSLRALEGIAVGVARNMKNIVRLKKADQFIINRISEFWKRPEVADMSASGLRGTVRIQRSISFGDKWFNPNA